MTNCTCVWHWDGALAQLEQRDPACEQHGDGSPFWRRLERRAAKRRHPANGT